VAFPTSSSYHNIQVFHKYYYDDGAQVKCSLSQSNRDSNRFLTSWRVYSPHKPHSPAKVSYRSPYCTIQDQFAGLTGTARTRGPFWRPRYPSYTKVARRALVVLLNHHQYSTYIRLIPSPNSVQALWLEQIILPAKCGTCVQYDKRAVNDRSLIDTGGDR